MPESDPVAGQNAATRTRCRAPIGVAVGALVLLMGLYLFATNPSVRSRAQLVLLDVRWVPHTPFDSTAWKTSTPGWDYARGSMLRDLIRTHGLVGMSRDQLEQLLGRPEMTIRREGVTWGRKHSTIAAYDLGACSGFRVDMDQLWVYMDDTGTVVAWVAVQT